MITFVSDIESFQRFRCATVMVKVKVQIAQLIPKTLKKEICFLATVHFLRAWPGHLFQT